MAVTTLILGAGLGKECGFPDGRELRTLILKEIPKHDRDLIDCFTWNPGPTVDEVAAKHPQHINQIKRIVVKIMREREDESKLHQAAGESTYGLIIRQIHAAQERGDIVRIITFNYDRSLVYLIHRINGIAPGGQKIDLKIVNPVYGRLAPLHFEDVDCGGRQMHFHEYGIRDTGPQIRVIENTMRSRAIDQEREIHKQNVLDELCRHSKINFIGEPNFKANSGFREMLEDSDFIFLLGIGYHKANMEALGFNFKKRHSRKVVAGTGMGLGSDVIKSLLMTYPAINRIEDCNAYTFLQTKFDISDRDRHIVRPRVAHLGMVNDVK